MEKWESRFWSKVKVGGADECWPWIGGVDRDGYGHVCCRSIRNMPFRQTRENKAHRIMDYLHHGFIPYGIQIRHKCDNPPCVNPTHLLRGTPKQNSGDRVDRGRGSSRIGDRNHNHKLSPHDVLKIRGLSSCGISRIEIAQMFSITSSNVTLIVSKKNWSHL